MQVVGLDDPPISAGAQVVADMVGGIPIELRLEVVEVLLLDGLDRAQHIPVDFLGTGRRGHTAGLDPAGLGVEAEQQVAVADARRLGAVRGPVLVREEVVEEAVDGLHLFRGDPGRVVDAVEHHTECGRDVAVGALAGVAREVHCVHLQIHAHAVHRVFRPRVPVELVRVEGTRRLQHIFALRRTEPLDY